jgi:hypothetical protein
VDLAGSGGEQEEMRRGRTGAWRSRGRGRRRRSSRRSYRTAGGGGHRRRRSQRALATLEVSTPRCGEADWALGVVERQVGVVLVTAEVGGVERAASVAGVSDLFKIRAFFFGRGAAGCVLRPAGMD